MKPPSELFAQVGVFRAEPAFLHCGLEHVDQLLKLKRFGNKPFRAQPGHFHGFLDGAKPGDDHGDDVGIPRKGLVEDLPAVHAGQSKVGQENVKRKPIQPLQRLFPGARLRDLVPLFGQTFSHDLAVRGLVFHE